VKRFLFSHGLLCLGLVAVLAASVDAQAPGRPKGKAKRTFFVMGHHANEMATFNKYVADGANFIEHDIHLYTKPLTFSGSDKVYIMHFMKDEFTRKFTNSDGVDAYYRNVKAKMDAGQVLGLLCDIKPTLVSDGPIHYSANTANPRQYGRVLANILKKHGIPANRVIMGVDHAVGSYKNYAELFMIGVRADAKYDCLLNLYVPYANDRWVVTKTALDKAFLSSQAKIDEWGKTINAVSDVGELGMDESVRKSFTHPWPNWQRWLDPLVKLRDARSGDLRFVYFWTVNNETDMHNALNSNVDGILTDVPATLKKVVSDPKYAANYRIATRGDYPIPLASRVKRSLEDPYVYLEFKNKGAYDTRFYVHWTTPGGAKKEWESGKCMAGQGATCMVPRNVKSITVDGKWSNGSSYKAWKGYPIKIKGGSNASFETTGTLISGAFKKVK
jgi:hypothetical protein